MFRLFPVLALACLLTACEPTAAPQNGSGALLPIVSDSALSAPSLQELLPQADAGDRQAAFTVGAMYHDGDGAPQDYANAKKYFLIAAEGNERKAQFNLGLMALNGEGQNVDPVAARTWFEKAAEGGNPRAPYQLGLLYYLGNGVEKDFVKAKAAFEQSAKLGMPEAQHNLAIHYIRGEGVEQDFVQGYAWLLVARTYGHQAATDAIDRLEPQLTEDQKAEGLRRADALSQTIEIDKAVRAAGGTGL